MIESCFLGIDAGTQGLSVVLTDEKVNVIASGEGHYDMLPDLLPGCYEQRPEAWERALSDAMAQLKENLAKAGQEDFNVLAIGISGQMHGEVLIDKNGQAFDSARLWCDSRNENEGFELTSLLGVKMPKRITAARWLWTTRNDFEKSKQVEKMTTPAGWLAFRLTGECLLGIGDASGMFPVDQQTLDYDQSLLERFDKVSPTDVPSLFGLLPTIRKAGEDGGTLNGVGAAILGLPEGIPVAPAEGDQPAALAGSRISDAGEVSVSFGTSVCANSVGDRAFSGVSEAVDHFCAVDGKPINMVFLRNGTTFMNTVVEMFATDSKNSFADWMNQVVYAPLDCGGLLAVPFMDDEPGMGISSGGQAALVNFSTPNAKATNAIRAALTATIMNLKIGMEVLDRQGFPRNQIILTGGLTRTPELGQILADVVNTRVSIPSGADEGTAVGAAMLARYRHDVLEGSSSSWSESVDELRQAASFEFVPQEKFDELNYFEKYRSHIESLIGSGNQ